MIGVCCLFDLFQSKIKLDFFTFFQPKELKEAVCQTVALNAIIKLIVLHAVVMGVTIKIQTAPKFH